MKTSAKERLLCAADELFYREGVHTVGIDRVIEHAGVAKASLYNSFRSKEDLVLAYLRQRREAVFARVQRHLDGHDDPRSKLLAVFDAQAEVAAQDGFRGCAFANASAETSPESPVARATEEYRALFRELFTHLAAELGVPDPDVLGRHLQMLYDGALHSARMDHDPQAPAIAKAAAESLLDAVSR